MADRKSTQAPPRLVPKTAPKPEPLDPNCVLPALGELEVAIGVAEGLAESVRLLVLLTDYDDRDQADIGFRMLFDRAIQNARGTLGELRKQALAARGDVR